MASFKYLIFVALAAVYAVAAEDVKTEGELNRAKKSAYYVAAPAPVLSYSAAVPAAYPYYNAYTAYPGHAYKHPASAYPAYAVAPYAAHPYAAYPSHYADHGKYYPGKYEKTYYPAAYPAYKTGYPAYKTGYPVAYHY